MSFQLDRYVDRNMFIVRQPCSRPLTTLDEPVKHGPLKKPTAEVVLVDDAAQRLISATSADQVASGKERFDWRTPRENRYLVALKSLSSFKHSGQSVEVLVENVSHLGLKTALATIRNISRGEYTSEEVRTYHYGNFLGALRAAVNETVGFDSEVTQALCLATFVIDIKTTEIGVDFIDKLLGDYHPQSVEELSAGKLESTLKQGLKGKSQKQKLTDIRRKMAASSHFPGVTWDPVSYSIRSHLATVQIGAKDVTFFRTAAPVVGENVSPQIDPLFIGMLRELKAKGKQYLYINNQSADAPSDGRFSEAACESKRVAALKALSESPEFKGMFHVVSFAHDSAFYKRAEEERAVGLKAELVKQLFSGEQGYFLPSKFLDIAENSVKLHELVEHIHEKYFESKEILNLEERQEFIHIAYAAISELIIVELGIDTVNATCKDGVDRAAGSVANLFKYSNPNIDFSLLLWNLSFPAVLNHARPPKAHRHEVSIATLKRIDRVQRTNRDSHR